MEKSSKFKAGLLLMSFAAAAGATAALYMMQKKREEQVYREAELKAMDELEQMMRAESDCASCSCAEECASLETSLQDAAQAPTDDEDAAAEIHEDAPHEDDQPQADASAAE